MFCKLYQKIVLREHLSLKQFNAVSRDIKLDFVIRVLNYVCKIRLNIWISFVCLKKKETGRERKKALRKKKNNY